MDNRAFSRLDEGALVLADISGYSAFVAQTEIDHSWEILHELLDTMVRSVEGRLDVSQVEGDCILFISGLTELEVLEALETTFVSFHRRLRDMRTVTTCPCEACANIDMLKLKFVVHRGSYSRQRLGSIEQLHGTDVIVAHRLLKNKVPSKEYVLVTDAVLGRLPVDRASRFAPYSEDYDVGAISGGYEEIAHLWEAAQATERKRVLPEEALLDSPVTVDASVDVISERMLRPDFMKLYMHADRLDAFEGARGADLGTEYHCHHGQGMLSVLRVVSIDPNREVTVVSTSPGGDIYITTRFEPEGPTRTVVRRLGWWDASDPMSAMVTAFMNDFSTTTVETLRSIGTREPDAGGA